MRRTATGSGTPSTAPATLLAQLNDQERLLLAVAAGLPRDGDLDREYWVRARMIANGLAAHGLRDPLPYRDLGAWVGECTLRLTTPEAQRTMLRRLLQPVRTSLAVR